MKKLFSIIVLICIILASLLSCDDDYYFFKETRDFADYEPLFDFFPEAPSEEQVLFFGDTSYNYWSHSADEYLALKFETDEEFSEALSVVDGLKETYKYWEEPDFLLEGYDCIFFQCSFHSGKEESLSKYCSISSYDTFYTVTWDLVMYSESDRIIVYNLLRYDTRNFQKWDYREAYITEHLGINLESLSNSFKK